MPFLGMINPNMGMTVVQNMQSITGLGDALFSRTQQRVLGLLFGQPDRSFFANELISMTGGGSGAVQRELRRLESSGLVTIERRGNQKHYQANAASPIYADLCAIVRKTFGLAAPVLEALNPFTESIKAAFIFGSVAKKQDHSASDIDLMVVSDILTYADLFEALGSAEAFLGRPINPTIYSEEDLRLRAKADNAFVVRVINQPKIWLIGDDHALPT